MADIEMTRTQIFAAASAVLEKAGFNRIPHESLSTSLSENMRFFEDDYSVVGIEAFDTWVNLSTNWKRSLDSIVNLISKYPNRSEPKAWDGYLVLMTPSLVPLSARIEAERIRYDMSHVRKIIVTGDDFKSISDVETSLLPIMPLSDEELQLGKGESLEDILLTLLVEKFGVDQGAVRTLMESFRENRSLMESLHTYVNRHET